MEFSGNPIEFWKENKCLSSFYNVLSIFRKTVEHNMHRTSSSCLWCPHTHQEMLQWIQQPAAFHGTQVSSNDSTSYLELLYMDIQSVIWHYKDKWMDNRLTINFFINWCIRMEHRKSSSKFLKFQNSIMLRVEQVKYLGQWIENKGTLGLYVNPKEM